MIDLGGTKLVLQKNCRGETALHEACWYGASLRVIKSMLDKGGKKLLMMRSKDGCTALQFLCRVQSSPDTVKYLLELGGTELVFMKCNHGWNPLHEACDSGLSLETVKHLVNTGGKNLVLERDHNNEWNSFFWSCDCGNALALGDSYNAAQSEIVRYLIDTVGDFLVGETDQNGDYPIHLFVRSSRDAGLNWGVLRELLNGGMKYFRDESLVAGLFGLVTHDVEHEYTTREVIVQKDNSCSIFQILLDRFDSVQETLSDAIEDIVQGKPLLQAAISNNSSSTHILQILNLFPWTVLTTDSLGRLPIQVAVEKDLKWNEGVKVLVHATADHNNVHPIIVAAAHGVKWENGMQFIVQNNLNTLDSVDPSTNLYPFALAAAGNESDLTSIYKLVRCSVDLAISF
jgi:ankyrin repeat protein